MQESSNKSLLLNTLFFVSGVNQRQIFFPFYNTRAEVFLCAIYAVFLTLNAFFLSCSPQKPILFYQKNNPANFLARLSLRQLI